MAPDLNSVPASPRNAQTAAGGGAASTSAQASRVSSTTASRRASQIFPMSPPPLPLASPGGGIPASASQQSQQSQHTLAFPPLSPGLSGHAQNVDASGVPIRHPRPLTAAELHLELEKEQEAVVNRLTRELSALRAHSASVASTASSATSAVLLDATDPALAHGPTHPTASRRHRSSSSVSRTSASAPYGGHTSYSGGTTSHPHRYSISSQPANDPSTSANAQLARSASVVSTPRYEETAHWRQELEEAKRENETLKKVIRDLERRIQETSIHAAPDAAQRGRRGAPAVDGAAASHTTNQGTLSR